MSAVLRCSPPPGLLCRVGVTQSGSLAPSFGNFQVMGAAGAPEDAVSWPHGGPTVCHARRFAFLLALLPFPLPLPHPTGVRSSRSSSVLPAAAGSPCSVGAYTPIIKALCPPEALFVSNILQSGLNNAHSSSSFFLTGYSYFNHQLCN